MSKFQKRLNAAQFVIIILLLGLLWYLSRISIIPEQLDLPANMSEIIKFEYAEQENSKISLKQYASSAIEIFAALDAHAATPAYRIPLNQAQSLHDNYKRNISDPGWPDTTRAIYFKLSEIFAEIKTQFGNRRLSSDKYKDVAMYAYFGRYGQNSVAPYQTTVVIQLAKDNGTTLPTTYDSYFDFGDLCPKKCPQNETIK